MIGNWPTHKKSFDAETKQSQLKAPRPCPMESTEVPPELQLEQECDLEAELRAKLVLAEEEKAPRKGSLDQHFTILAFIDRRIEEKKRQRYMSAQNVQL